MKKLLIALSVGAAFASITPSYASADPKQDVNASSPTDLTHIQSTWVPPSIRYKQPVTTVTNNKRSASTFIAADEVPIVDSIENGALHYTDPLYQITDYGLRSCIENFAIQQGYQWVSDVVEIQCHGYMISSLEGIQHFTSVNRLMIVSAGVTDLTPLASMSQLTLLDVWDNNVSSLSSITGLTQLEALIVGGNPITDVTPLSQFTSLKELALPNSSLTDLSVLAPLTQLEFVDIGQNPIQDYSALNHLPNLKAAHLDVTGANPDISSMLGVHRAWEWLGVNYNHSYCWQLDYIEKYHTFPMYPWSRPYTCDSTQDWEDFDGDGIANTDELQSDFNPLLLDTDNDGTPDGQLPGGDSYIWDAVYGLPDYSLQMCVNELVTANPAIQYASEITTLNCQSRGVNNLEGIQAFIKLKELMLSDNMALSNTHRLGELSDLELIEVYGTGMTDISWVTGLTKLKQLWIGNNPVADLTPLQNLTQLKGLGLPDSTLTDLSIVANLTNLEFLDLGMNTIADISALSHLTSLKMIDLSMSGNQDISPILRDGTHWEWLNVPHNAYCWQVDYVEKYNTFQEHGWYRPSSCDNTDDWNDFDGDGLANMEELHGNTSPLLFDTDNDGTPDGQLPGGDRYIWDAIYLVHDYQLNMCLQNVVNADPTIQYASQITTLDCQSQNISSLEGIDAFIALTRLEVSNNMITDLSPVASLPSLSALFAFNNQVSDLSGLSTATQLKELHLGGNSAADLAPLSQLTNLESLVLPNGGIVDLAAIAPLTQLAFLDIDMNPVSDLSVLTSLTNINTLGIWSYTGNDISSVLSGTRHWEWLGLNDQVYCWQLDYLEKYHTFQEHAWYRPTLCDSSTDHSDFDNDGISNFDELMGDTSPLLLDTDNDGTPDGQLPGGDSYIWDAYYQILDVQLQNCIYNQMMMHPEWEFASQVTELQCMGMNITTVDGLDKFIGLTSLELSSNNISDITPIFGLTNLETLFLMTNPISSISGIEALTNLKVLILFDINLTDITPIYSLTQLVDLALPTANFTDMSLLNGMTNLLFLDIAMNPVTDLSGFDHYHQLKYIGLDSTQVSDVSLLFGHTTTWEWIGLPPSTYCWQTKYIENYHTFTHQWYPNPACDNTQDFADYDADGMDNWTELNSTMTDPTVANPM